LDGEDDLISIPGLVTALATLTTGTVSLWVKMPTVDPATDLVCFSVSRNASATQTEIYFDLDTAANDRLDAVCKVDGAGKWGVTTPTNSLDAYFGQWLFVTVAHDGVAPKLYLNAVSQTLTWNDATDKTKWFKAILTDATSKADTASLGVLIRNGGNNALFKDIIGEVLIHSRALTASEIQQIYLTTKWKY